MAVAVIQPSRPFTVGSAVVSFTAAACIAGSGDLRLAFLGLAIVALSLMAIWWPGVLLATYLVVPPLFKVVLQPLVPVDVTVLIALFCTLQAVALLTDLRRGHISFPVGGLVAWCAFAALVWVSVAWAPDRSTALQQAAAWVTLSFIPLLAAYRVAATERHVRHFLRTMMAAAAIVAFAGLASMLRGDGSVSVLGSHAVGASRVALLLPVLAITLQTEPIWIRAMALLASPASIATAWAARALGPLISLAVLLAALAAQRTRLHATSPSAVAMVAVVSGLGLIAVSVIDTSDVNVQVRVALYGAAIDAFLAHPLVGLGTAGFESVIAGNAIASALYPHDLVLQFAAEYGLMGLGVLGWSLWSFWSRRDLQGAVWTSVRATFVLFLIAALFSSDILDNRLLWGTMLLVVLAPRIARTSPHPAPDPTPL